VSNGSHSIALVPMLQICLGGDVPESYYSHSLESPDHTGLTRIQVDRGKQIRLAYRVSQPGSILR